MVEQSSTDEANEAGGVKNLGGAELALVSWHEELFAFVPVDELKAEQSSPGKADDEKAATQKPEDKLDKLIASGDIEKLTEFALNADNRALAYKAVNAIIQDKPEGRLDSYREMAQSNKYAAGYGMFLLSMFSKKAEDHQMALNRLQNGDLPKLWQEGKVKADDLAYLFKENQGNNNELSRKEQIMKALDAYPEIKSEVCGELLRKPLKNSWNIADVPESMRLDALKSLVEKKKPQGYESILLDLIYKGDPKTDGKIPGEAYKQAARLWTTETKKNDTEQSISELFIHRRLADFAGELGFKPWNDGRDDTPTVYGKWLEAEKATKKAKGTCDESIYHYLGNKCDEEKANKSPSFALIRGLLEKEELDKDKIWSSDKAVEDMLADNPKLLAQYKEARNLEAKSGEIRGDLDTIVAKREEALNKRVQEAFNSIGLQLPEFKIKILPLVKTDEEEFRPLLWR